MKKFFLFFLVLSMGVGLAATVKANKSAVVRCCDFSGSVCAVVNGVTFLGPVPTAKHPCP